MSDPIPDMNVRGTRSRGGVSVSAVWLVPLAAVGIALFIAWRTLSERGPLIEVAFENATGVIAGQTALKYRALTVGMVEDLDFGDDLSTVIAHIRLDKGIAQYVDDEAKFWIVQPEVSARGVTGLDTVLTGVFIEGSWDTTPGTAKSEFVGDDTAPLQPVGVTGTTIRLRADQGGRVQGGAPLVYRGVTVGAIDEPVLAADGSGVTARVFIRSPYDQLITTNTRFWSASGFSVNVGPGGVKLDVANLSSLLQGGITFGTVVSGGDPITPDSVFTVYTDEDDARTSVFSEASSDQVSFSTIFEGAVGGLTVGAPVELAGIRVGQVTEMGAFIDRETDNTVRLRVDFALRPGRLGLPEDAGNDQVATYLQQAVEDGLHARLTNDGLLSGTLKIELVDTDEVPPGSLDIAAAPYPVIPSLPVEISDLSASAEGIVDRITALPVEELLANAVEFMENINRIVGSDGIQQAPEEAVALLRDAREQLAAVDIEPLMGELQGTATDLRRIVAGLGSDANVAQVSEALVNITALSATLDRAAQDLPALLASVQTVADNTAALDLGGLVDAATGTVTSVQDLARSPELQSLPGQIAGLVTDARGILASDQVQALPADAAAILATLQELATGIKDSDGLATLMTSLERLDTIMASVESGVSDLPAIQQQISDLIAKTAALQLEPLMASVTNTATSVETLISSPATQALPGAVVGVLGEARTILGSEATQQLPADLSETLASTQRMLAQIETSDGMASLLDALERLDRIAASIEATTDGLPALGDQVSALVAKADRLPLEEVLNSTDQILQSAETLLSSPDTAAIPANLNMTLSEVAASLAELRAGGTVENVNATLQSARDATEALAAAAETLPDLTARLNSLVSEGELLMSTYGDRSAFNTQILAALRDMRETAKAATALARTIERNPSALIRGR